MLKISYAGCLGLSLAISSQFSVEMCTASKNCEKRPTRDSPFGIMLGEFGGYCSFVIKSGQLAAASSVRCVLSMLACRPAGR